MKRNGFSISVISNLVAMAVSLGISFFSTPLLIEALGKEAYAFFPLANNFVSYMTLITAALNSMASRFITIELVKKNRDRVNTLYSSVFGSNVVLCLCLLGPILLIVSMADQILNIPSTMVLQVKVLFSLVFASMLLGLLLSVFGVAVFANDRMDLYAVQNIVANCFRALLYVVFFVLLPPSLEYLGLISLLVVVINGCFQYGYTKKLMPQCEIRRQYFNGGAVRMLVSSGIWNSVNSLGSILLLSVALLLANVLYGAEEAGNLSIVQTMPNIMTTVICTVYNVMMPKISRVYALGDREKTVDFVKFSQRVVGFIATPPVIGIMLLGRQFFSLWVPNENASQLQILSFITVFPLLIHSAMWTVYGLNVTNNKVKKPAIVLIGTGLISIMLTILLQKVLGCGIWIIPLISSLGSVAYYFGYLPSYAATEMGVQKTNFYPHITKTMMLAFLMLAIGYPLLQVVSITNWGSFFAVAFVIEILGCMLYGFIVAEAEDRKRVFSILHGVIKRRSRR